MINEEIAQIFERMSRVLAFKGADRFRVLAYDRAATSLRDFEGDLAATAEAGKLDDIPVINSDAHSVSQLELIRFGVYQARRGWVEVRDVVNSGPGESFTRGLRVEKVFRCRRDDEDM